MWSYFFAAFLTILAMNVSAADVTYEIKKGDELMLISKKFYGSFNKWKQISKANPSIKSDLIFVGQKIVIPDALKVVADVDICTIESVLSHVKEDFEKQKNSKNLIGTVKGWFATKPVSEEEFWKIADSNHSNLNKENPVSIDEEMGDRKPASQEF